MNVGFFAAQMMQAIASPPNPGECAAYAQPAPLAVITDLSATITSEQVATSLNTDLCSEIT